MNMFFEIIIISLGIFVILAVSALVIIVYTRDKVNWGKTPSKTDATNELKKNILQKAQVNSSRNSNLSSFDSQELSISKVQDDIAKLQKKKATIIDVNDDLPSFKDYAPTKSVAKSTMKNVRTALIEIDSYGGAGIFLPLFMTKTGMSKVGASVTLNYLVKNKYAAAVKSPRGIKLYLTKIGEKYCASEDFNMAPY